jgi:hypothetical protein
MNKQSGMTVTGLIVIGVIVFLVVILVVKTVPSAIEYRAILSSINSISADARISAQSDEEIRAAYLRYAIVEDITSVAPKDLKISREKGKPVISFAYEKRIPLVSRMSLVISYDGSSQ